LGFQAALGALYYLEPIGEEDVLDPQRVSSILDLRRHIGGHSKFVANLHDRQGVTLKQEHEVRA
jgi:hypothetical protein